MAESPKPEHFTEFKDWLTAFRDSRGLKNVQLAGMAGVSPQAVSKWLVRGGDVEPVPLRKIADNAGVSYAELRMLLDGQPLTQKRRTGPGHIPSHVVQRIARKLEHLDGDEISIAAVEALVDSLTASHAKGRKKITK